MRHLQSPPGWAAVLAYADDGEAVGYAYGNVVESDDRWWKRVAPIPDSEYTDRPAVALKELGARVPWRKTGTARRFHDSLLAEYVSEPYVDDADGEPCRRRRQGSAALRVLGVLEHRHELAVSGVPGSHGDDSTDPGAFVFCLEPPQGRAPWGDHGARQDRSRSAMSKVFSRRALMSSIS